MSVSHVSRKVANQSVGLTADVYEYVSFFFFFLIGTSKLLDGEFRRNTTFENEVLSHVRVVSNERVGYVTSILDILLGTRVPNLFFSSWGMYVCTRVPSEYVYDVPEYPQSIHTMYPGTPRVCIRCTRVPPEYIYDVPGYPQSIYTMYPGILKV